MSKQASYPDAIRVLVVDDSVFAQRILRQLLQNEPGIEVLDTPASGINALQRVKHLKPDVITLSAEEETQILQILTQIDSECPTPVIVLSSQTDQTQEVARKALQLGAYDLFPRPNSDNELELQKLRSELIRKIRSAGQLSRQSKRLALQRSRPRLKTQTTLSQKALAKMTTGVAKAVVIGTSTGGPQALHSLFSELPAGFPLPILVVQHMLPNFTQSLAESLHAVSALEIREARQGDILMPGRVLVAPANYHMELDRRGRIELNQKPPHCGVRPAVDMTLISASRFFQGKVLGVILTGMGQDGLEGIRALHEAGGRCLAEEASSCVVYGMPRAIIENHLADEIAPLPQIAHRIQYLLSEWHV
ncbi:chemotaxis response regulator protein-glutamate methylesterase [bacterium (Candidatus Blackallbacteria) CG17_big_fil_post_rev_8_21_14_2_50_48_46]|uniref:Protein-glutamate methylesterase/protein-glutamine glutaminase n=1 Tax=bacterium (Candidatus Blackallbacteria) CG17_big_fil_post_rev_8_21_14_2_50_48_46 TaxID=2014261 RepID=A0A2M7FYJ9_9BACT|nr:MAG: chemotaxis response regulator protein-glutamate methylesterase [bacterium (Candidatus Blackallbacteria) CG18_big_fil_WC_8_21_14_2_50_49_26]PIW14296.1 MAG: chemotaxis response regulator protein-glutamate methylesterase [bacterium (Candidatus Blackallbacteria) CG17_big_fil_post_rev_8_21_14_2_50_48_46]PIW45565.1 MAG: chemotaxis response regulator protein-glutamate methylesterase [bacterium (Candidatus Blackallbacteria) CG13_big_fil_rev_8_21_14_2_50_49_14]